MNHDERPHSPPMIDLFDSPGRKGSARDSSQKRGVRRRLRVGLMSGCGVLSRLGASMAQFTLFWWVTDTVGTVAALSAAGVAILLPQAVLVPLSEALARRHGRWLPMIVASLGGTLFMQVLVVLLSSERMELWHAYGTMVLFSAFQAFQRSSDYSCLAILVPGGLGARGVGQDCTARSFALTVGAPLGAFSLSMLPVGLALAIAVSTALLGLVPPLCIRASQEISATARRDGPWDEFRRGASLVWNTPGLRQVCMGFGAMALMMTPAFGLMPLLVKGHFGGGAGQLAGLQVLAGAGVGLGRLLMAAMAPRSSVRWVLGGFSASSIAIVLAAMVPSGLFGVAAAWWAMCGITFAFGMAPLTGLLQAATPRHQQRRVLSWITAVVAFVAPLGVALAGALGEWLGLRAVFVTAGLLGLGVCLIGSRSSPLAALDRRREENR